MTAALLFVAIALSGCAHSSATSNITFESYTANIAYSFIPGGHQSAQAPIVLWDQQWFDPIHATYYLMPNVTPSVSNLLPVHWATNNSNVLLSQEEPFTIGVPGVPVPTAAPGDTYIQVGQTYGRTLITMGIGQPISATATIEAIHFGSVSFGCEFRFRPSWTFDPTARPVDDPVAYSSADLYDTYPSAKLAPMDPCYNSVLADGSEEVWHAPYGGTIKAGATLQDFLDARASDWRDDSISFPASSSALLLLRTAGGRIVKVLLPIGPYETSDESGRFEY